MDETDIMRHQCSAITTPTMTTLVCHVTCINLVCLTHLADTPCHDDLVSTGEKMDKMADPHLGVTLDKLHDEIALPNDTR